MPEDVAHDDLAVIKVEGMHCHRCEQTIQKALASRPGVREVEVDFASGQASVLYDRNRITVRELMETVTQAGYRATGFTQNRAASRRGASGRQNTGNSPSASSLPQQ
ncbi:heavy-metal-associated domain-containing protein [Fontivita pretiosa]|uniref:heavy-metal-associated domain-containing protein n=1 Tax=Fontivita pretiosa TaxID=2989684 RepID=UPI003D17A682